jgi:hypothetical protein
MWYAPSEQGQHNDCFQRANHVALVQGCKLIVIGWLGKCKIGSRQGLVK